MGLSDIDKSGEFADTRSDQREHPPSKVPYLRSGEWGFTNDPQRIEGARQFRDAAIADGWVAWPTYQNESIDRAAKLHREGFVMNILTRDKVGSWAFEADVSIWGPDGLAIKTPEFYDFAELVRRTRICGYCEAEDVDTQRVGFAGRCCATCLPEMRKAIERPGWNN